MSFIQIRKQHKENGNYFGDLIIDTEAIAYIEGPTKDTQGKNYGCIYLKNGERVKVYEKEYKALKSALNYVDKTDCNTEEETSEVSTSSEHSIPRF